jgi:hypothetical protein
MNPLSLVTPLITTASQPAVWSGFDRFVGLGAARGRFGSSRLFGKRNQGGWEERLAEIGPRWT